MKKDKKCVIKKKVEKKSVCVSVCVWGGGGGGMSVCPCWHSGCGGGQEAVGEGEQGHLLHQTE